MHIRLPTWVWKIFIAVNVFNFGVGFIIADRRLMALALISGLCCYFSLMYFKNGENND